jgi:prepilin-type N-terminal cleavage/methylation domain-containing protein
MPVPLFFTFSKPQLVFAMTIQIPMRAGRTLVEVLVVLAILLVLAGLVASAVLRVRDVAGQIGCQNNLRQIGLGLLTYQAAHDTFPSTDSKVPWTVEIAPHVDNAAVRSAYDDRYEPGAPANAWLGSYRLEAYLCPKGVETRLAPHDWLVGNYAANLELLGATPSSCTDGTSVTGLAVEVTSDQGFAYFTGPSLIFGPQDCVHKRGLIILYADGSVRWLRESAVERLMPSIGTPAGDDTIPGEY